MAKRKVSYISTPLAVTSKAVPSEQAHATPKKSGTSVRTHSIERTKPPSQPHSVRRSISKAVLSPGSWFSGVHAAATLDGVSNSPEQSRLLPQIKPLKHDRIEKESTSLRRVVSTPEMPLQRRSSNKVSTVTRRPQAAQQLPVIITKQIEVVRQPVNQATIHPLEIQPAVNSMSPSSLMTSAWSPVTPVNEFEETGETSLLSDSFWSHASVLKDYKESPDTVSTREVRFDLPPIREVPTPISSLQGGRSSRSFGTKSMRMSSSMEELISLAAHAERCATAKIFFETMYENLRNETKTASPRSLRRRDLENSMAFVCMTLAQQDEALARFHALETEHLRALRCMKARNQCVATGISVAGYEMARVLGKGSFGVVSLVREKSLASGRGRSKKGGAVYAMKVIKKSEMLRQCQEAHLRIERDFMVKSAEKSRWIVPLVASFQDMDHLYLVMEFQIGGDFLNLLMSANHGIISEEATRFYVAEIILCVEEAHNMKIIHRDIKPDNFLISASGHLKLSDFGLAFDGHWSHKQSYFTGHRYAMMETLEAVSRIQGDDEDRRNNSKSLPKPSLDGQLWYAEGPSSQIKDYESRHNRRKMARSIVGTSQYMAPEVIAGDHYDGRCDWWSVGIILFECLFGFTPFVREDRQRTKEAISDFKRHFPYDVYDHGPQRVSEEAVNLISSLLTERQKRLCSHKYWDNDYRGDDEGRIMALGDYERGWYDYQGRFVYSNDAELLKVHPFFKGITWQSLHHKTPPFKPACSKEDSCQYFDTEEEILKDYMSDTMSVDDVKLQFEMEINGFDGEQHKRNRLKQPPKRARDKLLRDPVVGKAVMQERKKGAFLGYTYRRPKTWSLGNELRLNGDQHMFWRGPSALAPWTAATVV